MVAAMSIGAGIYWGDICHARLDELQSLNHLLTGHKLPISTTLCSYIHDDMHVKNGKTFFRFQNGLLLVINNVRNSILECLIRKGNSNLPPFIETLYLDHPLAQVWHLAHCAMSL